MAGITVTSLADTIGGPGVTLRAAIEAANTDTSVDGSTAGSGADTITFQPGLTGRINLTSELVISSPITITGLGQSSTTISGGNATRLFNIDDTTSTAVDVQISDLTLTEGRATDGNANSFTNGDDGGAIFSRENLTLNNVTLDRNTADADGGAIYVDDGTVSINGSTLTGNTSLAGGAVYNRGTATIEESNINNNNADYGGGIFSIGNLSISGASSTLNNNNANYSGGAIYNNGIANLSDVTISSNDVDQEDGGGIFNNGTLIATDVTIGQNDSPQRGGGIFNVGSLTLSGSTVTGNSATGDGGGIHTAGTTTLIDTDVTSNNGGFGAGVANLDVFSIRGGSISNNVATGDGGGLYSTGTARVTLSTISGNTSPTNGGGVYNSGTMTLTSSTVSGNSATGADGNGGGVYTSGSFAANGSTIASNSATYDGGGVFNTSEATFSSSTVAGNTATNSGGGIVNQDQLRLENSIIAANVGGTLNDIVGTVQAGGNPSGQFNFIGDPSSAGGLVNNDVFSNIVGDNNNWKNVLQNNGTIPTLANNGGPNQTIALLPGSIVAGQGNASLRPADTEDIDNDVATTLLPLDGRGASRVTGDSMDIGAFEVITVSVADASDSEASEHVDFVLSLDSATFPVGLSISVQFNTQSIGGGATEGIDYTPVIFRTVNFTDSTTETVRVDVTDDPVVEADETFQVTISNAQGASVSGASNTAIGTIVDDDVPGITVTPTGELATNEDGTFVDFTVTLNTPPIADVTIGLTSSDPTEGIIDKSSLTFTPANWDEPQTVRITGQDDPDFDGNIAYSIVTAAASSTDPGYTDLETPDIPVRNFDDDKADINVIAASPLQTSEDETTVSFQVSLGQAPTSNVTIDLTSSDPTEGIITFPGSTLTFTPANGTNPVTVTVEGVDDRIVDDDVIYSIITGTASSDDTAFDGVDPADVPITNTDNDVASLIVTPTSGLTTNEGESTTSFTVALSTIPASDVTVTVVSDNPAEGTVSTSTLTFTPQTALAAQTVTITGVDDDVDDGDINYSINLSSTSVDTDYQGLTEAVTATNEDNDTAAVIVNAGAGISTSEAGDQATFTIVLASKPSDDVTIGLSSDDLSEGMVSPATITFTTDNWNLPQTVTATGQDDSVNDSNVTYNIVTTDASSNDPAYNNLDVADVAIVNVDDDSPGIRITPTTLTINEDGTNATFDVVLNTLPTADVTITLASDNEGEGTLSTTTLTFTPSTGLTPQTVTVNVVDDDIDDGDVSFTIVTETAQSNDNDYGGINPPDVSVVNIDNDTAGFTISSLDSLTVSEDLDTATVDIVLNSQPTQDVVVAISSGDTDEVVASSNNITFTPINWDEVQTLTLTGVNDDFDDGDISTNITTTVITSDAKYDALDFPDFTVTNTDNDTSSVVVNAAANLSFAENGGTAEFTVALSSLPAGTVQVSLASSDLNIGNVTPRTLVFNANDGTTPQTVTVTGVNDLTTTGDRTLTITTTNTTSVDPAYNDLQVADVTLTSIDDDAPGVTVSPTSGLMTSEDGGRATFTIVLDSRPTADVTVGITSDNTAEGTVNRDSVTFTDSNWNSPQTITVIGQDDAIADGSINFNIITADVVSSDQNYNGIVVADVSATNADDEARGITVTAPSTIVLGENDTRGRNVELSLDVAPADDVTINITVSDETEATVSTNSLVFTPSGGTAAQEFTVFAVHDRVADGDPTYNVNFEVVSNDPGYDGFSIPSIPGQTFNIDTAGITVSQAPNLQVNENGTTSATFTIALDTFPDADVTIALSSTDETEGIVSPAQLTFTPSNGINPQTVTITAEDDSLNDGDVEFNILIAPAQSSDPNYNDFDASDVSVTNINDDTGNALDFGDAPDPSYPTTLANDGARHGVGTNPLTLGATIDTDSDGQQSPNANGEGDDDDGVTFTPTLASTSDGTGTASAIVNVSADSKLDAWIDFDGNGTFDATEHLGGGTSIDLTAGDNTITFPVAQNTAPGNTFARFRVSTAGDLLPSGEAANGEVEDYFLSVADAGNDNALIVSDAAASGDTLVFSGAGQTLDLTAPSIAALVTGIESFDLSGSGDNTLVVDIASILDLGAANDTVTVNLDSRDTLDTSGDAFAVTGSEQVDDQFFITVGANGATIRISGKVWTNPIDRYNVNNDADVTAIDALQILNELVRKAFVVDSSSTVLEDPAKLTVEFPFKFYDVNRDGNATPLDALQIINFIARGGASPEGEAAPQVSKSLSDDSGVLATDDVIEELTTGTKQIGTFDAVQSSIASVASNLLSNEEPGDEEAATDQALNELLLGDSI